MTEDEEKIFNPKKINPWKYTESHTPIVVQVQGVEGGGMGLMEPLSRVFDMWQYFKTIWPSVESLCSSRQDEVYFMGGGAAGGLLRHQTWSPSWPSRIRNQV